MASSVGLLTGKQAVYMRHVCFIPRPIQLCLVTFVRGNHYDVLGVDQTATTKEIRAAFLKKSKECHPDMKNRKSDHDKFVKVNEAYSILSKRTTRRDYDLEIAGLKPSTMYHRNSTAQANQSQQRYSDQYQRVFYDEQILNMQNRARSHQGGPAYGLNGLSRISNIGIVIGCIAFTITGIILHTVVVKKSSDTLLKNLSDRDVKIHTMWTDAVNEAKQYSKEEHYERLKDYQETAKWRRQK